MENLSRMFQKQKRKKKHKKLSFINHFNIEFLLPFTGYRKVLGELSGVIFDRETSHLICSANRMTSFVMECNTGLKRVKNYRTT